MANRRGKNYTLNLKKAEIDHSLLPYEEKEKTKRKWETWIETITQGYKDELRTQGRLKR